MAIDDPGWASAGEQKIHVYLCLASFSLKKCPKSKECYEKMIFAHSAVLSLLFIGIFSPVFANTLKWSMPGDSLTLDPHAQNEGPTHMVSRQVYEGLVTHDIGMNIQPQLATSWENTDPETWIFKIREGVVFHDGSELTASDAAFSIIRAKTDTSDMVDLIKSIKSAKAIDDLTL